MLLKNTLEDTDYRHNNSSEIFMYATRDTEEANIFKIARKYKKGIYKTKMEQAGCKEGNNCKEVRRLLGQFH